MKWGYSGYTKSETRGMLRDVKESEYVKSHNDEAKHCTRCGKVTSDRYYTDDDKLVCKECWDIGE